MIFEKFDFFDFLRITLTLTLTLILTLTQPQHLTTLTLTPPRFLASSAMSSDEAKMRLKAYAAMKAKEGEGIGMMYPSEKRKNKVGGSTLSS